MQLDECVEIMREVRDLVRLMALRQADAAYGVGLFDPVSEQVDERHAHDWNMSAHQTPHTYKRSSVFYDDSAEAAD